MELAKLADHSRKGHALRMRLAPLVLVLVLSWLGCTTPAPALESGPAWQRQLLAAESLDIGWVNVEGEPVRKVLTGTELASVKQFFSKPLTNERLKCFVHIDASIRVQNAPDVLLCFGCGTVVIDKAEWNRVEKDELRALFTQLLGPRPKEPPVEY